MTDANGNLSFTSYEKTVPTHDGTLPQNFYMRRSRRKCQAIVSSSRFRRQPHHLQLPASLLRFALPTSFPTSRFQLSPSFSSALPTSRFQLSAFNFPEYLEVEAPLTHTSPRPRLISIVCVRSRSRYEGDGRTYPLAPKAYSTLSTMGRELAAR